MNFSSSGGTWKRYVSGASDKFQWGQTGRGSALGRPDRLPLTLSPPRHLGFACPASVSHSARLSWGPPPREHRHFSHFSSRTPVERRAGQSAAGGVALGQTSSPSSPSLCPGLLFGEWGPRWSDSPMHVPKAQPSLLPAGRDLPPVLQGGPSKKMAFQQLVECAVCS